MSVRGQLAKMLITLDPRDIFGSDFAYLFIILTLSSDWYEASLSIISAGRGLLAKMFITLQLHGIFRSHFAYKHCLDTGMQNGDEESDPSCSVSKNAHNS